MKPSCATLATPTPSPRAEPTRAPARCAALLLATLCALPPAAAHGEADDLLPTEPGLVLQAAAAMRALRSRGVLPSTRLDGVLLKGDAGTDPEDTPLEHAQLAAAWRASEAWGAYAAASAHGREPLRVEAAWLQWRHDTPDGDAWLVTAGRQLPVMGPVLAAEGHLGPTTLAPLAHRAAWDTHAVDDGVQASWRGRTGATGAAELALDLGIWRGHAFPGASHGGQRGPGLSLHAGATWGAWGADVTAWQARPRARGTGTSAAPGHNHGSPACDERFTEVLCFDGRASVLGGSLRWAGADSAARLPLTLSAAAWWRRDSGLLESANGLAHYQGRSTGGWLDAEWALAKGLALAARLEQLDTRHRLQGQGAGLLAQEGRLHLVQPARRNSLHLNWQAASWARWSLQAGREDVAGRTGRFVALRLVATGRWWVHGQP